MSVQASSWVIEHSKHSAGALLVMLMIANHAHADGTGAYPTTATLARECRMSERQVRRLLPELEASGELVIFRSHGRRSHTYAVAMGDANREILAKLQIEHAESQPGQYVHVNPDNMSTLKTPNPDKLSTLTRTSATPNPDICDSAYKEEPSLEPSVERARSKPSAKSSKTEARRKTRPDLDDRAWLSHLAEQTENRGIDVFALYARMVDWCRGKRTTPTRLRLLAWLKTEREDMPVTLPASVAGFHDPGRRPAEYDGPIDPLIAADADAPWPPQVDLEPSRCTLPEQTRLWQQILDEIQKHVSPDSFRTWFARELLVFDGLDIESNKILLRAGQATRDWIAMYYTDTIVDVLNAMDLAEFEVAWEVIETRQEAMTA